MVEESILMIVLDKIVAGSAYQAWSCSRRVLEFPLRAGHYLFWRTPLLMSTKERQQKTFLDKVSLKHILLESILFIPYSKVCAICCCFTNPLFKNCIAIVSIPSCQIYSVCFCSSLWSCNLFQFFELYSRLLSSTNYVTRRQAIKVWLFLA